MGSLSEKEQNALKNISHPVDVHVGKRLKHARLSLGITQEKLASLVGLTFQQVQKYENGTNRVSASRLFDLASALQKPVSYFFEGLTTSLTSRQFLLEELSEEYDAESVKARSLDEAYKDDVSYYHHQELQQLFFKISDPQMKQKLLKIARVLAENK
jgi:transcriptional regulator with XRE-family HTH domain